MRARSHACVYVRDCVCTLQRLHALLEGYLAAPGSKGEWQQGMEDGQDGGAAPSSAKRLSGKDGRDGDGVMSSEDALQVGIPKKCLACL